MQTFLIKKSKNQSPESKVRSSESKDQSSESNQKVSNLLIFNYLCDYLYII